MSTHAFRSPAERRVGMRLAGSSHRGWLGIGLAVAFAVPYVLEDVLALGRDLYYGIYALAVVALFAGWSRATGYDLRDALRRRLPWAVGLGGVCGGLLAVVVIRSEAATARPSGLELAGAVVWRGLVYGVADGLLLSVFPILVVFAAFTGWRRDHRRRRTVAVGAVALLASLLMTAVYHAGYNDFRSAKVRKPVAGDLVWSAPTLATLNPVGAPIAHAAMHVTAVLHSYDTNTYLPPHR